MGSGVSSGVAVLESIFLFFAIIIFACHTTEDSINGFFEQGAGEAGYSRFRKLYLPPR
jgi:hypothetical protein